MERIPYKEGIDNKRKLQEYIMLNNALADEIRALEKSIIDLEKEKADLQNHLSISLIKRSNEVSKYLLYFHEIILCINCIQLFFYFLFYRALG